MAATPKEINKQIQDLNSQVRKQERSAEVFDAASQLKQSDSTTRQRIARLFVVAYFILLGLILIGVPIYNLIAYHATRDAKSLQVSLTDTIQTYSAVVGPTLGFVVAYYFKSKNEN